jgi:molybdopterin converting factor small subunit
LPIKVIFIGWLECFSVPAINVEEQSLTIDDLLLYLPSLVGNTGVFNNKVTLVSSTIILVNDCDIELLNSFQTNLVDGDTVTFIPISHGG